MATPPLENKPIREPIDVDMELRLLSAAAVDKELHLLSSSSTVQIQEGTSGSPAHPEHAKKADTQVPLEVVGPSGLEENDDARRELRTLQFLPVKKPRTQLEKELTDYMKSLLAERILDSQFGVIQELQDESDPEWLARHVTLFLTESEKHIEKISTAITEEFVDVDKALPHVHQQRISSTTIGAQRLKNTCYDLIRLCEERNGQICWEFLEKLEEEYSLVKSKLKTLMKLEKQILEAGGSMLKMKRLMR